MVLVAEEWRPARGVGAHGDDRPGQMLINVVLFVIQVIVYTTLVLQKKAMYYIIRLSAARLTFVPPFAHPSS